MTDADEGRTIDDAQQPSGGALPRRRPSALALSVAVAALAVVVSFAAVALASGGAVTVGSASNSELGKKVVVNPQGRTLYALSPETQPSPAVHEPRMPESLAAAHGAIAQDEAQGRVRRAGSPELGAPQRRAPAGDVAWPAAVSLLGRSRKRGSERRGHRKLWRHMARGDSRHEGPCDAHQPTADHPQPHADDAGLRILSRPSVLPVQTAGSGRADGSGRPCASD